MTQRNNSPQTIQATLTGVPELLRVAPGFAPVVVVALALALVIITLITVQLGAGFGYV